MRYALVNGEKQGATKGEKGLCLCCGRDVIAKCGEIRCNHWAHKNTEECPYSQKEPKTRWHLDWQNHFPKEWQEVRCIDEQTGEIHIADIKTPNGLVIEFQHSAIKPEERLSREHYYKNMIWVVDGTRSKCDFKRFLTNFETLTPFPVFDSKIPFFLYIINKQEDILPENWLLEQVPLYFDFRLAKTDDTESELHKSLRNSIWGFFRIGKIDFVVSMSHNCFVDYAKRGVIRKIEQYAITTLQKVQMIHMLQQKSQLQNIRQNYRFPYIRRRRRL